MSTKITDHYFKFGGLKYFRGNAHLVQLATFGELKNPIGAKAYLDTQGDVQRKYVDNYRVNTSGPVTINWSKTSKADVEANGDVKVYGVSVKAATSFSYEKVRDANLKLYSLSMSEGRLTKMLNNDADGARKYLAQEGRDGRIVSEVWIVMEAELAEHFDTSGSVSISAKGDDLNVTASGGTEGSQTITLSEGSVFAYKLHKIKDWNKGKTKIEDMEADYYGLG